MYVMAKHLHLTAVGLSILLFVLRFLWSQANPQALQKKWLKILPHVIDTLLLGSAIGLCFIIQQYPFVNGWVTFKLIGLLAYIGLGLVALKLGKTPLIRWAGFVGALGCLALIGKVAVTKQILF